MKPLFKICFSLVMLLLGVLNSYGQICNQDLSVKRNDPLKYSERGNRCEGFYVSEIAQPYELSLTNLTCGPLDYHLSDSDTIKIKPLFDNKNQIHIQASSLQLRKYYRMDAEISSDTVFEWPVADVLKPASLASNTIGICGKILNGNNSFSTFIPLKVYTTNSLSNNCQKLLLRFSTNVDLDFVVYSVETPNDDVKETKAIERDIFYAGKPIDITLDINSFNQDYLFSILGRVYDHSIRDEDKKEKCEKIGCYFIIDLSENQ